jgi:hypothetical protein
MAWHARRMTRAAVTTSHPTARVPRGRGQPSAFRALDFEPVLPPQWFSGERTSLQPAKRLMLAVLTDAIELVIQDPAPQHPGRALCQRRAADWIRSNDRAWCFSFVNVCETLGYDPKHIRTGIARLVEQRDSVQATAL